MKLSILDFAMITQGGTAKQSLTHSLDLAQHAEQWGYERFWLAEHHNMPGIASAATSVALGYIAAGTERIRIGSGGIMLPNHSPLVIAEQFGTLETLYPGRIDLGLGRAPGTDGLTLRALRRKPSAAEHFPQDVAELKRYFGPDSADQKVRAYPGTDLNIPLWILGSSLFGAQLAAQFGLPYAFASQFAPQLLEQALQTYYRDFEPSAQLNKPYAMAGVNVVVADTTAEAQYLFSSVQQMYANMVRGSRDLLAPPIDNIEQYWSPMEKMHAMGMLECSMVGDADTVAAELRAFKQRTMVDEIIVVSTIYDHSARLHSYQLLAELGKTL